LVSQTGDYNVRIRYSARQDSQNARYSVKIGDQTISGAIRPTGEAYQYQTFPLGTIKFPKAGEYTVQIKPSAEYEHNLMFFQSLELAPVGLRMVD
jgi:hypothetical protein